LFARQWYLGSRASANPSLQLDALNKKLNELKITLSGLGGIELRRYWRFPPREPFSFSKLLN
jgi:hypothetical protein